MITYEQAVARKRETVLEIVEKLTGAGAGKMDAYALIASETGKSSTWVRRIIGRSPNVRIDIHDALNIHALHDRLHAHLAAGNDALAASNADLRRQIDALACAHGDHSEDPASRRAPSPEAGTSAGAGGPALPPALGPDASAPAAPGPTVLGLTRDPR